MAKRINVGGRYMNVRERNTSKGKRGTFIKRWTHKKTIKDTFASDYLKSITAVVIVLLIILLIAVGVTLLVTQ